MKYLSIILILFISACSNVPKITEPISLESQSGLVPLAVGNMWKYKNREKPSEVIISTIERAEEVNGVTWFLYNEMGEKFWVRNEDLAQYESIGSFEEASLNTNKFKEALVLSKPDRKEKTYYLEGGLVTYKPCSKQLVVLAGTFDCHIYKFDLGDGYYSISYYAENIGVLLNKFNSKSGYEEMELFEYKVK